MPGLLLNIKEAKGEKITGILRPGFKVSFTVQNRGLILPRRYRATVLYFRGLAPVARDYVERKWLKARSEETRSSAVHAVEKRLPDKAVVMAGLDIPFVPFLIPTSIKVVR